jgi:hypothetical protein
LAVSEALILSKLDRLGRNAMNVRATVEALAAMEVRVHCMALGGVDLTGPMAAIAERDLLTERTQPPCPCKSRWRALWAACGAVAGAGSGYVVARLAKGESVAALAREFDASRTTFSACALSLPAASQGLRGRVIDVVVPLGWEGSAPNETKNPHWASGGNAGASEDGTAGCILLHLQARTYILDDRMHPALTARVSMHAGFLLGSSELIV